MSSTTFNYKRNSSDLQHGMTLVLTTLPRSKHDHPLTTKISNAEVLISSQFSSSSTTTSTSTSHMTRILHEAHKLLHHRDLLFPSSHLSNPSPRPQISSYCPSSANGSPLPYYRDTDHLHLAASTTLSKNKSITIKLPSHPQAITEILLTPEYIRAETIRAAYLKSRVVTIAIEWNEFVFRRVRPDTRLEEILGRSRAASGHLGDGSSFEVGFEGWEDDDSDDEGEEADVLKEEEQGTLTEKWLARKREHYLCKLYEAEEKQAMTLSGGVDEVSRDVRCAIPKQRSPLSAAERRAKWVDEDREVRGTTVWMTAGEVLAYGRGRTDDEEDWYVRPQGKMGVVSSVVGKLRM